MSSGSKHKLNSGCIEVKPQQEKCHAKGEAGCKGHNRSRSVEASSKQSPKRKYTKRNVSVTPKATTSIKRTNKKAIESTRAPDEGVNNNATPELPGQTEMETHYSDHVVMSVNPHEEDELDSDIEDPSDDDNEVLTIRHSPRNKIMEKPQNEWDSASGAEDLTDGDMDKLTRHPVFVSYIQKLVVQEIQSEKTRGKEAKTNTPAKRSMGIPLCVKSPLDTIIYMPALAKINQINNEADHQFQKVPTSNDISNFIQGIRLETHSGGQDGLNRWTQKSIWRMRFSRNAMTSLTWMTARQLGK